MSEKSKAERLRERLELMEDSLRSAPPGSRPRIVDKINELEKQIATAEQAEVDPRELSDDERCRWNDLQILRARVNRGRVLGGHEPVDYSSEYPGVLVMDDDGWVRVIQRRA